MHFVVKNAEAYNEGKATNFDDAGYKVIDDHTFQVTLENPTPYFLSLINHQSWFPVPLSVVQYGDPHQRGNQDASGNFVGNAPFVFMCASTTSSRSARTRTGMLQT